jgi:hypothetical protein
MAATPSDRPARATRANWPSMLGERSRFIATAEVARLFGVTRQRVGQIRRRQPSFPVRQIELDGGPIWIRSGIEIWAALHRPGAVPGSIFLPHGARLLARAEQTAAELGLAYIGAWHLWLAIVMDDERTRLVFRTLGLTAGRLRRITRRIDRPGELPPPPAFLNPRAQQLIDAGASAARKRGSGPMEALDLAIALIDADEVSADGRRRDFILADLAARGMDVDELRRRLDAVRADPGTRDSFEPRAIQPLRVRPAQRPPELRGLAPNPLGHDPWLRRPWGSVFGGRKDERFLKIDGAQWFFAIDRDGFFVRAADGRPVGYRWRPPASEPVNGFLEVLPMPPDDVANWPDHRY